MTLALVLSLVAGNAVAQNTSHGNDDMYGIGNSKGNEQLVNSLKARQKALRKEQQVLQN